MKNNNGKIVLAIVAMFAVAAAIVGVTYAYFVANVVGNTNTSANVTAGILQINYESGEVIAVENIVPGWTNDGNHYYDPVASVYDTGLKDQTGNTIKGVKAVTKGVTGASITNPTEDNGLRNRETFTVSNPNLNDTNDTAYYVVKLTGITNELHTDDQKNFKILLTNTSDPSVTQEAAEAQLKASGDQMLVTAPIEIAVGDTHNYEIALTYDNVPTANQDSQGKSIIGTIQVIGVANNGTNWVDADGNVIFAA